MTDVDLLRIAVLDNPYEVTPRLVLADALDEIGDADEAAFIRADVPRYGARTAAARKYRALLTELRFPPGQSRRGVRVVPLDTRWRECLGGDYYFEVSDLETTVVVDGGHVVVLLVSWRRFRRHAGEWFRRNPITTVVLTDYQTPRECVRDPGRTSGDDWGRSWMLLPYAPLGARLEAALPAVLWRELTGYEQEVVRPGSTARHRCYADDAAARRALSLACVTFGRKAAGLGPLAGGVLTTCGGRP